MRRQFERLPDLGDFFDESGEIRSLRKVLEPFVFLGFRKGVEQGLKQGVGLKVEDVFTHAVQLAIKQKVLWHAELAIGTTKDKLQELLREAVNEGLGIDALAKNINEAFSIQSRPRSVKIARTELTDVINDGTLQTISKGGYREKEWSTVIDGRERATHAAANAQTVAIDQPFTVGGSSCMYPGHDILPAKERVHCRCTIVAAGIPLDRSRQLGEQFLRIHGSLEFRLVVQLRHEFERQRRRILSHFPS